jgi:hypothetical protein
MNTIARILPVRHTNYFDTIRGDFCPAVKSVPIDIHEESKIKETIISILFNDGPRTADYLLVSFDSKVYLVERDSDTSYCKREITYHPLIDKLKSNEVN